MSDPYVQQVQTAIGKSESDKWEKRAREVAIQFGVDPNLPPDQRCSAIYKVVTAKPVGNGFRRDKDLQRKAFTVAAADRLIKRDRVPGEDDE